MHDDDEFSASPSRESEHCVSLSPSAENEITETETETTHNDVTPLLKTTSN